MEVLHEFKKENLVVKSSEGTFNNVTADHNLEWLNGVSERGGELLA